MEKNKKNLKNEEAYREKAPADMINEPESNEQEDTGSAVSDENNIVKSRKERKLEKKARKEERKKLHPGPFRRSFLVIKEETEGIKNLYRDMNSKERENSDEAFALPPGEFIRKTNALTFLSAAIARIAFTYVFD